MIQRSVFQRLLLLSACFFIIAPALIHSGYGQTPPTVVSLANRGNFSLQIGFSIAIQPASATNIANYSLTNSLGSVAILSAAFGTDSQTIQLSTASQLPYAPHWLTINNVADAASGQYPIAPNSQFVFTNVAFSTGYIMRQLYFNIGTSTAVSALTSSSKYPNNPDQVDYPPSMGWPVENIADGYGGRFSGYLVPPLSGYYYFAIRSDDNSQLYLSSSEDPSLRRLLTSEPGCCEGFDAHVSGAVSLVAGKHYYIEALMKEGGGEDYLYVAWRPPGTSFWDVIPGSALGNYLTAPGSSITIAQAPADTSVMAGQMAQFNISAAGSSLICTNLTYQWQLNGFDIPGATAPAYTTQVLSETNNGDNYRVLLSIPGFAKFSREAVLTVTPDIIPPSVVRAFNIGPTNLQVVFSEPVEVASATNTSNYLFTNGVTVTGAYLDVGGTDLLLTTSPLVYGAIYDLFVSGVRDQARLHNTIASNTIVSFLAAPYAPLNVGNSPAASSVTFLTNGFDVLASGADIGGLSDQFSFQYQVSYGDFDIATRVAGLSLSDLWAKAGLIARQSLDPKSTFAAALATPSLNGSYFEHRDYAGSAAVSTGNFPANYPNSWLRLTRSGSLFSAFASYDGVTWAPLGSASITMSDPIYFGFGVSSHSTQSVIAQFRDIFDVTNPILGTVVNPHETPGPSSRKSPIAISEIMYKPAPRTDARNTEFIELFNSNPWFHDISGYQLVGPALSYTFPPGTIIPGGGYIVVAASPADIEYIYGLPNVLGPYQGTLRKTGPLQLLDEARAVLLTVPYSNLNPWPVAAHGTGHSLVLANPSYGEEDPRAWDISDSVDGSPGQTEAFRPSPLRQICINELLTTSATSAQPGFVELYNHSTQPIDVSGCILTDQPAVNLFVYPGGSVVPAGGFLAIDETRLGFPLSAAGGTLYLFQADRARVLDAVQFEPQEEGVSLGRWPDGAMDFYPLSVASAGTNNGSILIGGIVINELMYDPISQNDDDQYIELYNRSTNTVSLGLWKFTSGVSYTFPASTVIAPNAYLVVARNITNLWSNYPNLNATNTVGNFTGKLSHNGERVTLAKPRPFVSSITQGYLTNTIYVVEDEVTYGTGGRWGQWAAGGGSSLELVNPWSNHRLAANWRDSDETHKSSWATIETVGVLDNGQNYDPSIRYAQIGLLDVGECLVDSIEIHPDSQATNYVVNGDFETGLGGWTLQGCHYRSSWENEGASGTHSLHIRCSDRFWTGDNSCEMLLTANSLAAGQTATLRFKARWLCGWPEAIMRLNGNWFEATDRLPVPSNLGTPGMRNSRYLPNAGPAIYEVVHTPSIPAASQPVLVTARVHAAAGVQNVTLFYRPDPSISYLQVPMRDDGLGGDTIANDGVFTATLPGRSAGTVVAFYVSATDSLGTTTRSPALRNDNAPAPECVVMFGDSTPRSTFGAYHLWITQTNVTRWSNLSDLSNEAHDCTMVSGNRVIYNVKARFAGSPYHQGFDSPYGNPCHYKWIFPEDDKFLGATSFNKIHQPGNGAGDDTSLQREQTANTFLRALGVPWLNRRCIAVYVNGRRRGTLMEDAQTPDADVVKEHFPNDSGGWLYKMQPWFEFGPAPSGYSIPFNNVSWCNLMPYTSAGGFKKVARYRYNFLIRRTPYSANDFTNVFSLVDAAKSYGTPNYVANMENMADMENWMRVFAANHAAGNWDAFGGPNAQNLYGYIGQTSTKYSLLMFDFNIVLGNSGSWGPGQNLFATNGQDPDTGNIYSEPEFRRMYWRALQELVNGPLDIANTGPLLDAKYNMFVANGMSVENPVSIKSWLKQAHDSIASQITAENTTSFTVNPSYKIINGVAYFSGTAPVNIKSIWVNGAEWPLKWQSVTSWTAGVPLQTGSNFLSLVGVDIHGVPVAGASNVLTAVYNTVLPSPVGSLVINEIMYAPTIPGAQYIELYNSTNTSFDLSAWGIPELSYVFPPGSQINAHSFLVLAANRLAFAAAYGATTQVFDTFAQPLPPESTLSLVRPASNTTSNSVVCRVHYGDQPPWPPQPSIIGSSLQLIDPLQDNWRVGNWSFSQTNTSGTTAPTWQYASVTGIATKSTMLICMHGTPGDVYIDDLQLVPGSVPEDGTNMLLNAGFELPLSSSWILSTNMTASVRSTAVAHSGNSSLHVVASSAGDTIPQSIWQNTLTLVTNATYTLSYWYLPSTNGSQLLLRLAGSSPSSGMLYSLQNIQPVAQTTPPNCTPGSPSSVATNLPPFPPLWLNEVQPENLTGLTNSAGQHVPWIEIYNPGKTPVSLAGLFLSIDYSNLAAWPLPEDATIEPGEFKIVFADGQIALSTTNELHAGFQLSAGTGSLALSRLYQGIPQVLDYLDYTGVLADWAYGSTPDGQSFIRQQFQPTPGLSNSAASFPASFIPYDVAGSVYSQSFDSLPNPGWTSVNAANPVTIGPNTYSLSNPVDFAAPVTASGEGGLGNQALRGWYGLGALKSKFGAGDGDQTTGGQISFGLPADSNRALGLLSTTSTGPTAFGAKFINTGADTLQYLSLEFTAELWRQSDLRKTVWVSYYLDPTGTNAFPTAYTTPLPGVAIDFPPDPSAIGGIAVDGTAPLNQLELAITDQPISNWTPGAALWLVWQMPDTAGKAQGIAVDNLQFSAAAHPRVVPQPPLSIGLSNTNLFFSCPSVQGWAYQLEFKSSLDETNWTELGPLVLGTGAQLSFTNQVQSTPEGFYRLRILP